MLAATEYLLPAGQLFDRINGLYQTGETAPVRRFVLGAPAAFFHALDTLKSASAKELERGKDNHLRQILDAIATTAIVAAECDNNQGVKPAHDAFWRIYERANRSNFPAVPNVQLDATWVWGSDQAGISRWGSASRWAVLVERRRFAAAADLIEQPVEWHSYWESHLWCPGQTGSNDAGADLDRRA